MIDHVKTLREWGYEVERSESFVEVDGEKIHTLRITGAEQTLYARENDEELLAHLADPDAHIERVTQLAETPEETMDRHGTRPPGHPASA